MSPPNSPRLDYFDIFKKCLGLGAAVELTSCWEKEDFTREAAKDCIICLLFNGLRASSLRSATSIPTAM
jgi:hypothetical protein